MCRYAMYGPYKLHYVCFACLKMFRQINSRDRERYADYDAEMNGSPERRKQHERNRVCVCPQCKQPMHNMGLDFKAPPQHDVKQWEKVRLLAAHGYRWHSCGCGGYGPDVAKLRDVQPFLEAQEKGKQERECHRQHELKMAQKRQRVRKARRERERKAAQGVALSEQRDNERRCP